MKIIRAIEVKEKGIPGQILDKKFTIACSQNAIQVLELQEKTNHECNEYLKGNNLEIDLMLAKTINYLIKIVRRNKICWLAVSKNGVSVQEKIEKALSKIFKSKIKINGAGRTDKGVHALGQYANFKINRKIDNEKNF